MASFYYRALHKLENYQEHTHIDFAIDLINQSFEGLQILRF